jgi:hydroxyacylglutathione hydrolase
MPGEIITIPCLSDNYAYLVHAEGTTMLIDAPEAGPIIAALEAHGWGLDAILITHHHHDHVGAVADLVDRYGARVCGPRAEEAKLPPLAEAYVDGDTGGAGDLAFTVIAVPGHTLGHIAYHFPKLRAVFTADSLMALGCGRVFEGTPAMMWDSLSRLAALPEDTVVHSGHEYTAANARFALTIEPENAALRARADAIAAAREANEPTAQVPLSEELATNPFLRAGLGSVKAAIGMKDASDTEAFAEIRGRKDRF